MPLTRRDFLKSLGVVAGGMGLATASAELLNPLIAQADDIIPTKEDHAMAHELPALPYAYDALEPYYNEETLHLHHDKHHAAYVNNWNAAEEKVQKMLSAGDFAAARAVSGDLAFNGSGDILHSIFWTNMKPGGGGEPSGDLAKLINQCFGSFDAFKQLFLATTNAVQGSGWGILAYRWMDDALVVLGAEKHENGTQWGAKPILALDVWEHAYYLQYQNKRPDWTKTFMENLVNWDDVALRLSHISKKPGQALGIS